MQYSIVNLQAICGNSSDVMPGVAVVGWWSRWRKDVGLRTAFYDLRSDVNSTLKRWQKVLAKLSSDIFHQFSGRCVSNASNAGINLKAFVNTYFFIFGEHFNLIYICSVRVRFCVSVCIFCCLYNLCVSIGLKLMRIGQSRRINFRFHFNFMFLRFFFGGNLCVLQWFE